MYTLPDNPVFMLRIIVLVAFIFTSGAAGYSQQLFTMSNQCLAQMKNADRLNNEKKYDSALALYKSMGKCNSKDAKEQKAFGAARAYNGLKEYDQAIAYANEALKQTKNTSINGYFQRAMAYNGKKMVDSSRSDFERIIQLTEKNQNIKERATIYAMIGDLYSQSGLKDSATANIDKAISLDPGNASFYIQKGDLHAREGDYDGAFVQYDKAVELGRTDVDMYKIRTEMRMKMVQDKYKTDNAQELRNKMTATEKQQVCTELKKLISLGYKNMKADMFDALVCK
jgi:tetratricopeptide (TPR) repeat protein